MNEQDNILSFVEDFGVSIEIPPVQPSALSFNDERDPLYSAPSSNAVFDLFDEDTELQDAGQADLWPEIESFKHVQHIDTLSPLSGDAANHHAFLKAVGSGASITSSNGGIRARLPRPARELMDKWIEVNQHDPYLKPDDAEALAHLTRLTTQQVKTYIANARARRAVSGTSLVSLNSTSSLVPRRASRRGRSASSAVSLHPMDSQSMLFNEQNKKYHCTWPPCIQSFARKSDWKRHEETIHAPQEEWICMPHHPVNFHGLHDNSNTLKSYRCEFCATSSIFTTDTMAHDVTSAADEHLTNEHKYLPCFDKPLAERTFARKDKLKQHLQQVHGQDGPMSTYQTGWVRSLNEDAVFECLFCKASGMSWSQRVEHVAAHFETGEALEFGRW